MYLRQAESKDLARLASIGAAAFATDAIYGHFHPLRSIYPQDFYDAIFNTLRRLLVTPGAKIMLAEVSGDELMQGTGPATALLKGEKKIVGYLTMIRYGAEESVAAWNQDSKEKQLQRQLLDIEEAKVQSRSAAADVIRYFNEAEQSLIGNVPERIEAPSLAVLPEFQRLGVGKKLMAWLFPLTDAEQVPIFADASTKGLPLYLSKGFTVIEQVKLRARTVRVPDGAQRGGDSGEIVLEGIEVPVIRKDPKAMVMEGKELKHRL